MSIVGVPDYGNAAVIPGALLANGSATSGTPFSKPSLAIDNTVKSITVIAQVNVGDLSVATLSVTGNLSSETIINLTPPAGVTSMVVSGRCLGIEDTSISVSCTVTGGTTVFLYVFAEYYPIVSVNFNGVEMTKVGQYGTWTVNQGGSWTVTANESPANPANAAFNVVATALAASMATWAGPTSGSVYLTNGVVDLSVTAVTTAGAVQLVTPAGAVLWRHWINGACQLSVPLTYPWKRSVTPGASGTVEVTSSATLSATGDICHSFDYTTAA